MNTEPAKTPYRKPTIERVDLVGEETAAIPNCKRTNGGGRGQVSNACRTEWFWDLINARCRESRGS